MVKRRGIINRQARTFLRTGRVGRKVDATQLARDCDRLVRAETQRSLPRALSMAERFVRHARRVPQMPLQLALRSLAWALHASSKYRRSEKAYLEARRLVLRDAPTRARIDRILIDVYMYLGDFKQARRRAEMSIRTFAGLGDSEEQAKTRINYGNLFHRQDRHREAQTQYERARIALEGKPNNELILALCYYNLANTQVQLFDLERARSYYQRARDLFVGRDFNLYAVECDYGLAWLHMLEGDYHIALRLLGQCETAYAKAAQKKGVMLCRLDRAEAYLGLNLFADAYEAAKSAGPMARKLGLAYESSKAAFFRSRSAHSLGKEREAMQTLSAALAGFRKERNRGFEAAVRLFEAQSLSVKRVTKTRLNNLRRLFARTQLPLWEAICDLELLERWPDDTVVHKRLARNPAVKSVPHLLAQWKTQLGDLEARASRSRRAASHWKSAAEILEAVRAKLPPVEMRAAYMRGRADPYRRIIAQSIDRHPVEAGLWVDRFKTVGTWAAAGEVFEGGHLRDEAEQSLTRLANQVSALAGRIGDRSRTRESAVESNLALRRLQSRVRDNLAVLEQSRRQGNTRIDQLLTELKTISLKQPVAQIYQQDNDLFAFVHADGESVVHRYPGGARRARELLGIWQILVNRSLAAKARPRRSDLKEEQRLFEEFGSWLWAPLEISPATKQVLIIPDGILSNVPWSAFRSNGQSLADIHRILLAPTIQHHVRAKQINVNSRRVAVFTGSRDGLRHTQRELDGILDSLQHVTIHDQCTRGDWPGDGDWNVWHYTGHARFRSDNPFYSSLSLADGPLFGADFRLKRCRVELVTLAACRTGNHSLLSGEEATGLVRCLLEMGARNVIGSLWAVMDKPTAFWMRELYRKILDRTPITEAVRQASLKTREKYPSVYAWASFSVFGAG